MHSRWDSLLGGSPFGPFGKQNDTCAHTDAHDMILEGTKRQKTSHTALSPLASLPSLLAPRPSLLVLLEEARQVSEWQRKRKLRRSQDEIKEEVISSHTSSETKSSCSLEQLSTYNKSTLSQV